MGFRGTPEGRETKKPNHEAEGGESGLSGFKTSGKKGLEEAEISGGRKEKENRGRGGERSHVYAMASTCLRV